MKTTKRILSMVLALVMVMCLSVTAFAAESSATYSVSIYVQDAMRDADDNVVYNSPYITSPIIVYVSEGETLKDAINAACEQTDSIISAPIWKADDSQYLISLSVAGTPYDNQDSFTYDAPSVGQATYEGFSWMYFDGTPDDMPASSYTYPDVSLGNRVVTNNMTITLSYEYLTYIWNYR